MSATWNHIYDSDVYTLQSGVWYAHISPHSAKPNGDVAFWLLEIKNMLGQSKKHAHFTDLEAAKKEAEAEITGEGTPQHLYAVNW